MIGCKIPAVSEVISHDIDGFVVDQNPKAIADKIIFLLQNESIAQKMGAAGKEKVDKRYTWDQIAQRVVSVYEQALGVKSETTSRI